MNRRAFVSVTSMAFLAGRLWGQKKYSGPRPPKPDLPYLLHGSNLIPTEAGDAREEQRKDETANIISGPASSARTPLAEPIFLIDSEKLANKMELYRMEVKNGNREVSLPNNPKKRKDNARPLRLSISRMAPGIFRLEADQSLENGEYCLTPSGSMQVFCFQVY